MKKGISTKRLLTIGGGSGQFALLAGLRDLEDLDITSVVSMVDSGGSTGRLRDEMGILPPGDVLKCILALSPYRDTARNILLKRFVTDRRLRGHNAGNILLTFLSQYTGSFPAGVQALSEILDARGTILPVTVNSATLVAELTDGSRIYGEAAIDLPRGNQREKIRDVYLVPHHRDTISVYPPVLDAIENSDYVIIGPGDLFTSIFPNLIVEGVKEAIQETKAHILYIVNIMTKFGETHNYECADFIRTLEDHIDMRLDGIIINTAKPKDEILQKYREQKAALVEFDGRDAFWRDRKTYPSDLLDATGDIVRHDSKKLAVLIADIISKEAEK